jgi:chromosome segregation protein
MVDNLEGFPESIRFLKKNTDWAKNAPLFSDVLFCREEFRVAIENYLEPMMNHYVVESYDEAIKAINLLSTASSGRAHFLSWKIIAKQLQPNQPLKTARYRR